MSDQVIALLVQDNLDLACQAIEKAARERATLEVEEGFVTAFDARRRHREVSAQLSSAVSLLSLTTAIPGTSILGPICASFTILERIARSSSYQAFGNSASASCGLRGLW